MTSIGGYNSCHRGWLKVSDKLVLSQNGLKGAAKTVADLCLKSSCFPLFFKDDKSWESLSPDPMPSGSLWFNRICVARASMCTWEYADRLSFPDRWTRRSEDSVVLTSSWFFLNESAYGPKQKYNVLICVTVWFPVHSNSDFNVNVLKTGSFLVSINENVWIQWQKTLLIYQKSHLLKVYWHALTPTGALPPLET